MMVNNDNLRPEQYKEFFSELITILDIQLKKKGIDYKFYKPQNFLKIKIKEFPSGYYEIQFVKTSPTHKHIFGDNCEQVVAYYYKGIEANKEIWLNSLKHYEEQITNKFKGRLVIGHWNENWAMLGVDITSLNFRIKPDVFAHIIVNFVDTTYSLVEEAYKSLSM